MNEGWTVENKQIRDEKEEGNLRACQDIVKGKDYIRSSYIASSPDCWKTVRGRGGKRWAGNWECYRES